MLVLKRTSQERIRILDTTTGREIWLVVLDWSYEGVRVGIEAPAEFEIQREEIIGKPKRG